MALQGANCDNLWKLWYAFLVFTAYAFLTYSAVSQYTEFKAQAYDPRYGGVWIEYPLDFYVGMLVIALALLPVFLYSALVKVGNMPNDDVIIGKDVENLRSSILDNTSAVERGAAAGAGSVSGKIGESETNGGNSEGTNGMKQSRGTAAREVWKRIRRHFLPYSCYLHVISAYALLLPLPTLQAEQIRNEALPAFRMWHSDLDFIFRPDLAHPAYSHISGEPLFQESLAISPEMCNFIIALTLLTVRLPNSFWYASRAFALLFSFNLLTTSAHLIFNYAAISVLYKIGWNPMLMVVNQQLGSPGRENIGKSTNAEAQKQWKQSPNNVGRCGLDGSFDMFLSPTTCIALESMGFLLIILGQIGVYEYGHGQFLSNLKRYRQYLISAASGSSRGSSHGSEDSSSISEALRGETTCCYRFWPNIFSLFLLVTLLFLKVPLTCQFVQAYWCTGEKLFFGATIMSIIYLSVWLLLWFCFTVKTSWRFQVDFQVHNDFTNPNAGLHQQQQQHLLHRSQEKMMVGPGGEPIYGCFHENGALSQSSNSSDTAVARQMSNNVDCCSDSSKGSSCVRIPPTGGMGGDGGNYVYMAQQGTLVGRQGIAFHAIPTISEHVDGTASEASYDTNTSRTASNIGLMKYSAGRPHALGNLIRPADEPYATLASIISGNPAHTRLIAGTPTSMDEQNGSMQSLNRANRMRRSGNRVTFKEPTEVPESPGMSSNHPSSDSGFGGIGTYHNHQRQLSSDSLLMDKTQPRNYEDYTVFGNLFAQPSMDNYGDVYNGQLQASQHYVPASNAGQAAVPNYLFSNSMAPVPQPPGVLSSSITSNKVDSQEFLKVPDILMNEQGIQSSEAPNTLVSFTASSQYPENCTGSAMDMRIPDGSSPPSSQMEMLMSSGSTSQLHQPVSQSHMIKTSSLYGLSSNVDSGLPDQSMCSQV